MNITVPLLKFDQELRQVWGVIAAEQADRSNEIMDYASSKANFQKWSKEQHQISGGKSLGNLRVMHDSKCIGGHVIDINYDDERKEISICGKVDVDEPWKLVKSGTLTAFSIGGGYQKKWKDPVNPKLTRYTANPREVSLVDRPCLETTGFTMIKSDGKEPQLDNDILLKIKSRKALSFNDVMKKYSPDEPRDASGRWTNTEGKSKRVDGSSKKQRTPFGPLGIGATTLGAAALAVPFGLAAAGHILRLRGLLGPSKGFAEMASGGRNQLAPKIRGVMDAIDGAKLGFATRNDIRVNPGRVKQGDQNVSSPTIRDAIARTIGGAKAGYAAGKNIDSKLENFIDDALSGKMRRANPGMTQRQAVDMGFEGVKYWDKRYKTPYNIIEGAKTAVTGASVGALAAVPIAGGYIGYNFATRRNENNRRRNEAIDRVNKSDMTKGYNANEARDANGRWTNSGAHSAGIRAGAVGTDKYASGGHEFLMQHDAAYRSAHTQVITEDRGRQRGASIGGIAAGVAAGLAGAVVAAKNPSVVMAGATGAAFHGIAGGMKGAAKGARVAGSWPIKVGGAVLHGALGAAEGAYRGVNIGMAQSTKYNALAGGILGAAAGASAGGFVGDQIGQTYDRVRSTRQIEKSHAVEHPAAALSKFLYGEPLGKQAPPAQPDFTALARHASLGPAQACAAAGRDIFKADAPKFATSAPWAASLSPAQALRLRKFDPSQPRAANGEFSSADAGKIGAMVGGAAGAYGAEHVASGLIDKIPNKKVAMASKIAVSAAGAAAGELAGHHIGELTYNIGQSLFGTSITPGADAAAARESHRRHDDMLANIKASLSNPTTD